MLYHMTREFLPTFSFLLILLPRSGAGKADIDMKVGRLSKGLECTLVIFAR